MHRGLKLAVVLAIGAFLMHAAFTQFYETGLGLVLAPIMALGVVAVLVAFLRRRPWSWRWVLWLCILFIAINLAFLPQQEHFGSFLTLARALVGLEVGACAIILAFMLHPESKGRFHASSAS
jgi:drug/metabolite transporter (DMT)-like permease